MAVLRVFTSIMLVGTLLFAGCAEESTNVVAAGSGVAGDGTQTGGAGVPFPGGDAGAGGTVTKDAGAGLDQDSPDAGSTGGGTTSGTDTEVCTPDCEGKECGPDGCGGTCGDIACECGDDGLCECTPDCSNKNCGDDGCGGQCGVCAVGSTCTKDGTCSCEETCDSLKAECGVVCGETCGSCAIGQACEAYECVCKPSCQGKQCGDDGCGGNCGSCEGNGECTADGQCTECVPNCAGKECGDDGCGGSCGNACGLGEVCDDEKGMCISDSCCFTNDAPGCAIDELEECVCNNNPSCCAENGSWGSTCVLAATLLCGATCSEAVDEPTCEGNCGSIVEGETGECSCASDCAINENCCADAADFCDIDPVVVSCEGNCGEEITVAGVTCSCEEDCLFNGNCCGDAADFCDIDPADSCEGFCDQSESTPGGCFCDTQCLGFGDCCDDACEACGVCEEVILSDSCEGNCDGLAESGCSCSADCYLTENCCPTVVETCGYLNNSCKDVCGEQTASGCWCDSMCVAMGDCCEDACEECEECVDPNSCLGQCSEELVEGAACQCDPGCIDRDDCCDDACDVCGSCDDTINTCDLPDACEAGTTDIQECGFCGEQTRSCGDDCLYGEWSECVGEKECAAGTSIPCGTGCGVQVCSLECEYAPQCEYKLDYYETNPADDELKEPESIIWQGWFHSADDVDTYSAFVTENDTFSFDWDMEINVSVDGGEPGSYTLCVEYVKSSTLASIFDECVTGINNVSLKSDNLDTVGVNDNGFLKVEVTGPEGCSPYVIKAEVK